MDQNARTEYGAIKIHSNVIATIVENTTVGIPGVVGIGKGLKTAFLQCLGKKNPASSIKIDFDKNGEATITIPLIVKHGYNIPETASNVQDSIKAAVENATNIVIKEININVQQIEKGGQ